MSRRRDKSEVEHLKGIIRKLQSENRHLRRQAKSVQRQQVRIEEWVEDVIEAYEGEEVPPPPPDHCPECASKEDYTKTDLGNRMLLWCKICGFRKTEKIKNEDSK